jgi:hypothetical protein
VEAAPATGRREERDDLVTAEAERVAAMREALLAWQRSVVADERDRPVGMRR